MSSKPGASRLNPPRMAAKVRRRMQGSEPEDLLPRSEREKMGAIEDYAPPPRRLTEIEDSTNLFRRFGNDRAATYIRGRLAVQVGKQVGNFLQRKRVEQAGRHSRNFAARDFVNLFFVK